VPSIHCFNLSFLIAFTQYLFDRLHDWHVKIFLVAAIILHLAHIFFQGLQINHSVVAFGIIVTAEPRGDEPRLTDFVMHELVTVDFRNVDRHLGLSRGGGSKGKMVTKATQTHFRGIRPPLKKSPFSQADPLVVPILSPFGKLRAGVNGHSAHSMASEFLTDDFLAGASSGMRTSADASVHAHGPSLITTHASVIDLVLSIEKVSVRSTLA
jgi:hypothetical protein